MRTVIRLAALVAAALVGSTAGGRAGEPQILGVIANSMPLPMLCDGGLCAAEASAFCLQQHAGVPRPGTAYVLADGYADRVKLEGRLPGGEATQLPPSVLAVTSARGNRAVRFALPATDLATMGVESATLVIGDGVSAVPATLHARAAADPAAAQQIAQVTGSLRGLGSRLVDDGGAPVEAARLLGRLVNAIPDDRLGDVPDRHGLWDRVVGDGPAGPAADDAYTRFAGCAHLPGGGFVTFRECLASQHDMLINPLNRSYWGAVDTGS